MVVEEGRLRLAVEGSLGASCWVGEEASEE